MVLGIIAGLAVCVLGWALIRAFEKATSHAVDSAADAIQKKFNEHREENRRSVLICGKQT